MDAITGPLETTARAASKNYSSRPGALIWFFRKSRDGWKEKYRSLKPSVKQLKNRVVDVTKSRDQWRLKAEKAATRLVALEAEVATLRDQSGCRAVGGKISSSSRSDS
jgi:hypothetical protein